jgi:hypothetical protein
MDKTSLGGGASGRTTIGRMNTENSPKDAATMAVSYALAVASVLHYPGFDVDIDRGELRVDGRGCPKTQDFCAVDVSGAAPGPASGKG